MLDVALTPRKILPQKQKHVAVIIDVFRASTTICTALEAGAECVVPVRNITAARRRQTEFPHSFLGGERRGLPPGGFDAGNSPFEYSTEKVRGKTILFTTTNGTAALLSAPETSIRIIGCFVNAQTVCNFVVANQAKTVTLICAGNNGNFSYEDALCAGMFAEALSADFAPTDEALAAVALYCQTGQELGKILRSTRHACILRNLGFARDIEYCITRNALSVVPVFDGKFITSPT